MFRMTNIANTIADKNARLLYKEIRKPNPNIERAALIAKDPNTDVNAILPEGSNFLFYTILNDLFPVATELIKNPKTNLNIENKYNNTPLSIALNYLKASDIPFWGMKDPQDKLKLETLILEMINSNRVTLGYCKGVDVTKERDLSIAISIACFYNMPKIALALINKGDFDLKSHLLELLTFEEFTEIEAIEIITTAIIKSGKIDFKNLTQEDSNHLLTHASKLLTDKILLELLEKGINIPEGIKESKAIKIAKLADSISNNLPLTEGDIALLKVNKAYGSLLTERYISMVSDKGNVDKEKISYLIIYLKQIGLGDVFSNKLSDLTNKFGIELPISANIAQSQEEQLPAAAPAIETNFAESSIHEHEALLPISPDKSSYSSLFSSYSISYLLDVRNYIEEIPLVVYATKNIAYPLLENLLPNTLKNFALPEFLYSKTFLFTAHIATGSLASMLLPTEFVNKAIVLASAKSASFGIGLASSHYLNEYKQEIASQEKPAEMTQAIKYCAATMFAYTAPALATCALSKLIMPEFTCDNIDLTAKLTFAGSECYSLYKANLNPDEASATDAIAPYIAQIGYIGYGKYGSIPTLKEIVAIDYMARLSLNMIPQEFKETYLDPTSKIVLDSIQNSVSCITTYLSGMVSNMNEDLDQS